MMHTGDFYIILDAVALQWVSLVHHGAQCKLMVHNLGVGVQHSYVLLNLCPTNAVVLLNRWINAFLSWEMVYREGLLLFATVVEHICSHLSNDFLSDAL